MEQKQLEHASKIQWKQAIPAYILICNRIKLKSAELMWTYLPGMFVNRIAVFIIEHFWLNGIKITNPASYALHNVYVVCSLCFGCVPLSRESNREPCSLTAEWKNWMRCKVVIGKILLKKKRRKKERQHREHIPLSSIHALRLQISGSNFCSCFLITTADFVTVGRSFSVWNVRETVRTKNWIFFSRNVLFA